MAKEGGVMMDDAAIEALLDEFEIPFGRLTRFTNGNCFISFFRIEETGLEEAIARMGQIGFGDVRATDNDTLIWFTLNGKTIEENLQ